jgi:hypothetical protein
MPTRKRTRVARPVRSSTPPAAPGVSPAARLALVVSLFMTFAAARASAADPVAPPALPAPAVGDVAVAAAEPTKFLRLVEDGRGGGRLETAIVTYRNDAGVNVKLVSAVHIGERSYFESLAKDFEAEDAVLYELVRDKDTPLPAPGVKPPGAEDGGGAENAIGQMQRMMKDTLNLEFQLDVIDYTKANFVHADLDRTTFERMQQERGETLEMMMLKQLMKAFTQPPGEQAEALEGLDDPEQMLREGIRLFTRPDMERQVKLLFARQLTTMEEKGLGLDLPEGSVIITERNKAAVKVLGDTLADGQKRNISIFYGAAHMPDFAKRLGEMGFKPVASDWKLAWDLTIRHDQPSALEELLIEGIKALGEEGF